MQVGKGRANVMCLGLCLQSLWAEPQLCTLPKDRPRQMIVFHFQIFLYMLLYFKLCYALYYIMKEDAKFLSSPDFTYC